MTTHTITAEQRDALKQARDLLEAALNPFQTASWKDDHIYKAIDLLKAAQDGEITK